MTAMAAALLLLLALSAHVAAAASPCAALSSTLSGQSLPTAKETRACLATIPYNKARSDAIVDTVAKTFALWPYLEIAVKSPTPELPSKVDIIAGLKKIKATKYESDYAFNKAVRDLTQKPHDGHTQYFPACYGLLVGLHALPLVAYTENNKTVVKVADVTGGGLFGFVGDETLRIAGVDRNLYLGAAVSAINNVSALDYLSNLGKKIGIYRDNGANFNALFVRPSSSGAYIGDFALRYGGVEEDSVTFTLTRVGKSKKETVTVPWLIYSLLASRSFTTGAQFFEYFCQAGTTRKASMKKAAFLKRELPVKPLLIEGVSLENTRVAKAAGKPTQLVYGDVETWLLADGKTGVFLVPSFDAEPSSWTAALGDGVLALKKLGIKRVIIDFQDNGGGYNILEDRFVETFFPSLKNEVYDTRLRAPSLAQELVKLVDKSKNTGSLYYWSNYSNSTNKPFTSISGFFFPVVTTTFNRRKGNYSSLVRLYEPYSFGPLPSKTAPFKANNILILTNGACFSACGDTASRLEELANVRTIAIGGFQGKAMAHGDGVVGNAYSLSSLLQYDIPTASSQKPKGAPAPLPINGDLYFPFALAYMRKNASVPADYVFRPAKYRLQFSASTVLDKVAQWEAAAKFF